VEKEWVFAFLDVEIRKGYLMAVKQAQKFLSTTVDLELTLSSATRARNASRYALMFFYVLLGPSRSRVPAVQFAPKHMYKKITRLPVN
jgi:hypothetical protein